MHERIEKVANGSRSVHDVSLASSGVVSVEVLVTFEVLAKFETAPSFMGILAKAA
jgi:hypothetical protein